MSPEMRHEVLVGSTATGLLLGAGAGLLLLALLGLGAAALPAQWERAVERVRLPVILLCLVAIPAVGGVLGWLEGRLKLR